MICCNIVQVHVCTSAKRVTTAVYTVILLNYEIFGRHFSFFTGGVNFRLSLVTYFNTSCISHLVARPG